MGEYAVTEATTPTRYRERMRYDVDTVHAILDAGRVAHVSFVLDGRPQLVPLVFGRDGDRLYLHASSGSRLARTVRESGEEGFPAAVAVTHVDSLVLSRSAMHHSMDYRCVIAHGVLRHVGEPAEQVRAFRVIVDHMVPGRADDCRAPSAKETAQTSVFGLDLEQVAARVRDHGLSEDPADLELPHWAGVVPLTTTAGAPRPDTTGPMPAYLAEWLDAS